MYVHIIVIIIINTKYKAALLGTEKLKHSSAIPFALFLNKLSKLYTVFYQLSPVLAPAPHLEWCSAASEFCETHPGRKTRMCGLMKENYYVLRLQVYIIFTVGIFIF